eukprot:1637300-Amphidinium_carterae.1
MADVPTATTSLPGFVPMAFTTTLGFVLCVCVCVLHAPKDATPGGSKSKGRGGGPSSSGTNETLNVCQDAKEACTCSVRQVFIASWTSCDQDRLQGQVDQRGHRGEGQAQRGTCGGVREHLALPEEPVLARVEPTV